MTTGTPDGSQVDANTVIEILRSQIGGLMWDNTIKAAQIVELQFQVQRMAGLDMKIRELELRVEELTHPLMEVNPT